MVQCLLELSLYRQLTYLLVITVLLMCMDIAFVIEWTKDTNVIVNDDRIKISPVNVLGRASLTYSPIATSDSGLITATVTVSPSDDSIYIQSVIATSFIMSLLKLKVSKVFACTMSSGIC